MKLLTQYVNYNISQYIIRGWYNPRKKEFPEFFNIENLQVWDNTKIWENPNAIDWCNARKWEFCHFNDIMKKVLFNKNAYYYIKKNIVPITNMFYINFDYINPAILRFIKKYKNRKYKKHLRMLILKNSKIKHYINDDDFVDYIHSSKNINYDNISNDNIMYMLDYYYYRYYHKDLKMDANRFKKLYLENPNWISQYNFDYISMFPEAVSIYKNPDIELDVQYNKIYNVMKKIIKEPHFYNLDLTTNPAIFEFDFNKTNKDFVKMTNLLYKLNVY